MTRICRGLLCSESIASGAELRVGRDLLASYMESLCVCSHYHIWYISA